MPVSKVVERLRDSGINYRILSHAPVYTCEGAAEATKSTTSEQVKNMLLIDANQRPIMTLLAGDRRVDLKKVARIMFVPKVRLARPSEVSTILGVQIGAVSPLIAEGIPILMDVSVTHNKLIYTSMGTHTESIAINPEDFRKLLGAKLASITE